MEEQIANAIGELMMSFCDEDDLLSVAEELSEELSIETVHTFAEAGVMTTNEGLVVGLDDGSEFQVTVVQSRFSEI